MNNVMKDKMGACVYAAFNTPKTKKIAYYQNNNLIGYESDKTKRVAMPHHRMAYQIQVRGRSEVLTVVSLVNTMVNDDPVDVFDMNGHKKHGHHMIWEGVQGDNNKIIMKDGHLFRKAAFALQFEAPKTQIRPFGNVHEDEVHGNGGRGKTRDNFFAALADIPGAKCYDFFAYCGHGVKEGLASAAMGRMAGGDSTLYDKFLGELRRMLKPNPIIIFYACSTGKPGGFAENVCNDLRSMNPTVWAHLSDGNGDTNPEKVRIRPGGDRKTVRDSMKEILGSDYHHWECRVKSPKGDHHEGIWSHYMFMTEEELRKDVVDADKALGKHTHYNILEKQKSHAKAA